MCIKQDCCCGKNIVYAERTLMMRFVCMPLLLENAQVMIYHIQKDARRKHCHMPHVSNVTQPHTRNLQFFILS